MRIENNAYFATQYIRNIIHNIPRWFPSLSWRTEIKIRESMLKVKHEITKFSYVKHAINCIYIIFSFECKLNVSLFVLSVRVLKEEEAAQCRMSW